MAIGPKGQAGIEYLRENGAAVCISSKKEIIEKLYELINSFDMIKEYATCSLEFGKREHIKKNNKERLDKLFKDMT